MKSKPKLRLVPAEPNPKTSQESDPEELLEAFQKKYFEAKYQIRQFELQILDLQKRGSSPEAIKELQLKMEALLNREKAWIKKLMGTIEIFKEAKKKGS